MVQKKIKIIYTLALEKAKDLFGNNLISVYLIGSLAHGGFSAVSSDIDVALVLNKDIQENDWKKIEILNEDIKKTNLEFSDKLSVFWSNISTLSTNITSGAFPPPNKTNGLFPPFDILDLCQHGILIYGKDIKNLIRVPNEENLFISGVEFLLSYVDNEKRNKYLNNVDAFMDLKAADISKNILFPVRLMFTLFSGKIGSNDDAAKYFAEKKDTSVELVNLISEAINIRNNNKYNAEILKKIFPHLKELYISLINLNIQKMEELKIKKYVILLEDWRKRILM